MKRTTLAWGLFAAVTAGGAGACTDGGDPTDDSQVILRTGEFTVPIGDSFTCFYLDQRSAAELSVSGAGGGQGLGGHHIIAYYADEDRPVGHHPCTDEEMTNLHQIAGSAGDSGAGVLVLHDGLALKVPPGKQFVLQSHYINATDSEQTVSDYVNLELARPEDVYAYVNYFVTNDDHFDIPPTADYTHTTYCRVNRDLDVALTLGHMHEAGRHYELDLMGQGGGAAAAQPLISNDWQPVYASHPPVTYYTVAQPLHVAAGSVLRQTCDWSNTTAHEEIFPREMCLSFMYYFPGDGDDIVCDMTDQ
ncbi:MAG TPA: hypothetical protein VHE35_27440 [Kofleriaceae bacterium]|nr:hypothetical protein [Kofleriaceae bacterium]